MLYILSLTMTPADPPSPIVDEPAGGNAGRPEPKALDAGPRGDVPQQEAPKVIFLDINGVLNGDETPRRGMFNPSSLRETAGQMDEDKVARLNRIVCATGARIVVISDLRKHWDTRSLGRMLRFRGLPSSHLVVGTTPVLPDSTRGGECLAWLEQNPAGKFVILDDICTSELHPLGQHHIQTTWAHGLQDNHVREAIAHLTAS